MTSSSGSAFYSLSSMVDQNLWSEIRVQKCRPYCAMRIVISAGKLSLVVTDLQDIHVILMFRIEQPKPVHPNYKQIISPKAPTQRSPIIIPIQSSFKSSSQITFAILPHSKILGFSIFSPVYRQPVTQHLLFDNRLKFQRKNFIQRWLTLKKLQSFPLNLLSQIETDLLPQSEPWWPSSTTIPAILIRFLKFIVAIGCATKTRHQLCLARNLSNSPATFRWEAEKRNDKLSNLTHLVVPARKLHLALIFGSGAIAYVSGNRNACHQFEIDQRILLMRSTKIQNNTLQIVPNYAHSRRTRNHRKDEASQFLQEPHVVSNRSFSLQFLPFLFIAMKYRWCWCNGKINCH
jgi:hypothetical protein